MRKKYDLVFGIGEACSCSSTLRRVGLQKVSYPLDWLFGSNFMGRCNLLASKFENFIDFQDLIFTGNNNLDKNNLCDIYENKRNTLFFNHDFPTGVSLNDSYQHIKDKYDRRINRLLEQIKDVQNILIVYLETPTTGHIVVPHDDIIKGYNNIIRAFPNKQIDLLYLSQRIEQTQTINLTPNITMIYADYKNKNSNHDYDVDAKCIVKLLKSYRLEIPLSEWILITFNKLWIKCIPIKKVRHQLGKKYHV